VSGALDAFRAQREAVDDLRARVEDVAKLIAALTAQVDAIAKNQTLRDVLNAERTWLAQTERVLEQVRVLREEEMRRFWPAVWRRWALALAFALVAAMASGAGYVWAIRPYELEMTHLRDRSRFLDLVAQRVISMNPAERRRFDALITPRALPRP
jgi:hypothetical protein